MSLLTTSAASIHQLFSAAALAGPPKSPVDATLSANGEGRTIKDLWSRYEIVADTLLSAGWLIEQHSIRPGMTSIQRRTGAWRSRTSASPA